MASSPRSPRISTTATNTPAAPPMLPPDPAWEAAPRRRRGLERKAVVGPRPV